MPSDFATRRFAWIVGVHVLLLAVTTVATLPANGAVSLASGLSSTGWKFSINVAWYALVGAQVSLLQVYAAFGRATFLPRLAVLAAGFVLAVVARLWWIGIIYFYLRSVNGAISPDFTAMCWRTLPGVMLGFGLPSIAVLCLRSRVGVIRRASPLAAPASRRFSVTSLLIATTVVAMLAGGLRLLSDLFGDDLTLLSVASFLLFQFTQIGKIVGLASLVLSARRRWVGGLMWGGSVVANGLMKTSHTAAAVQQVALEHAAIELLTMIVVLATLWPLRRAGYRLTSLP